MNYLFRYSMENKIPINLIYIGSNDEITYRTVIVRKMRIDSILVYDLNKQELRTFKQVNILSAAKQKKRGVNYA